MSRKTWVSTWFVILIATILSIGSFNYIIDPYGLNNYFIIDRINSKKISNTTITTRFKSQILIRKNFNAALLGSSRVGTMDPAIVNKYIKGNTFNLSYAGSNPKIQNKLFKYAYHYNKNINYLIYGIDFFSFNKNRTIKNTFAEFSEFNNKIDRKEKINNYDLYFSMKTFDKSIRLITNNFLGTQKTEIQYLIKNGMREYFSHIENTNNGTFDLDYHVNFSIKNFFRRSGIYKNYEFSYIFLNDFKDTLEFCRERNIKLYVYIPPMYSDHFDAIAKAGLFDEFELFKKELIKITNYIDFTGHNTISTSKSNFWDSSHLRKELTKVVIARIFNDTFVKTPDDFGTFVTKENIDSHLIKLRNHIKDYDLKSLLQKPFSEL